MEIKRFKQMTLTALSLTMLVGFSGQEKYVELEAYLNARSSAMFRSTDDNVKTVLATGTRGEILETKRMKSGNYGLRVKALSGDKKGQDFWVYYNVKNPDLKLFNDAPADWGTDASLRNPPTQDVENAQGAETIRETPAIAAEPTSAALPTGDGTAGDGAADGPELSTSLLNKSALAAINGANRANEEVTLAGTPPTAAEMTCVDCRRQADADEPIRLISAFILPPTSRPMDRQCSKFMNSQGKTGEWGDSLVSIMSEAKYRSAYLRDGAMGSLCPKFNELSEPQRLQAWTWFWTALGQEESGCNQTQRHGTTAINRQGRRVTINPREGYGVWAMEKDAGVRRGRGSACKNIQSVAGQGRCSIDIMYKNQLAPGGDATRGTGIYWGPINNKRTKLMPHMRRFALCF